jgi:Domain of unknown function (DUF4112)
VDSATQFVVQLLGIALVMGVAGVAIYLGLRALFLRAADHAVAHIDAALTELVDSPAAVSAGRVGSVLASRAVGVRTPWTRYTAAEGVDEARARQELWQSIDRVARLMDSAVRLPIIGAVGLDALLGLVPFVGDATSAAVALSLVARSLKYGLPREIVTKMLANVLLDFVLGAIPLVGDLADIWFRANVRNAALLREYLKA